MSDNQIQNEEDLWDVLNEPVAAAPNKKTKPEAKPSPRPKTGPKFAKPEPVIESVPAAVSGPGRKIDGFFLACMAGVAAVSVAATLVISGMAGISKAPAPVGKGTIVSTAPGELLSKAPEEASALELENAELRQQVELQKKQIKELQAELIELSGGSEALPPLSTDPGETNELRNDQVEAYDIFHQIQEAYDDFDRETLEKLIPEMDKRLSYLSSDALNEYYLILEYVEQPSNG